MCLLGSTKVYRFYESNRNIVLKKLNLSEKGDNLELLSIYQRKKQKLIELIRKD